MKLKSTNLTLTLMILTNLGDWNGRLKVKLKMKKLIEKTMKKRTVDDEDEEEQEEEDDDDEQED